MSTWSGPQQLQERRLWAEIARQQLAVVGDLEKLIDRTMGIDGELLVTFAMMAPPEAPHLAEKALVKSGDWKMQREYEEESGRHLPYYTLGRAG